MKNTHHTPGPWEALNLHGENYCIVEQKTGVGLLYHEANARLIAAAPDLLEALRDLIERSYSLDQSATHEGLKNCDTLAKARKAIDKATK